MFEKYWYERDPKSVDGLNYETMVYVRLFEEKENTTAPRSVEDDIDATTTNFRVIDDRLSLS